MATIDDIIQRAQQVRDNTAIGSNTAPLVGGVVTDTAEHLQVAESDISTLKTKVNTNTAKLNTTTQKAETALNLAEELSEEGRYIIEGNVTNNPDEVTLTSENDKLQLKNRRYLASVGGVQGQMGYIILAKGQTFKQQVEAIGEGNTIFDIRYDYDLGGAEVTIPESCTLKFEGGKVSNGTLVGNGTELYPTSAFIFDNVEVVGFNLPYIDPRWFGAVSDYDEETKSGTDNSSYFETAINHLGKYYNGIYIKVDGQYLLDTTIETEYDVNFVGNHSWSRQMLGGAEISDKSSVSLLAIGANANLTLHGRQGPTGTTRYLNLSINKVKVIGVDKTSSGFIYTDASGAPSRMGSFVDCEFNNLLYALSVNPLGDTVFGNFSVDRCLAYGNDKFIESANNGDSYRSFTNISITNSNIEQNGENCLNLQNVFGPVIIDNCILEGEVCPIKIRAIRGVVSITNNYFEKNGRSGNSQVAGTCADLEARYDCYLNLNYNSSEDVQSIHAANNFYVSIANNKNLSFDETSTYKRFVDLPSKQVKILQVLPQEMMGHDFGFGNVTRITNRYIRNGVGYKRVPIADALTSSNRAVSLTSVSAGDVIVVGFLYFGKSSSTTVRMYRSGTGIADAVTIYNAGTYFNIVRLVVKDGVAEGAATIAFGSQTAGSEDYDYFGAIQYIQYDAGDTDIDNFDYRFFAIPKVAQVYQPEAIENTPEFCINTQLNILVYHNNNVWRNMEGVVMTGVTRISGTKEQAEAMTLTSANAGLKYYATDSNLKKYILWNGSTWTNLDGTALS